MNYDIYRKITLYSATRFVPSLLGDLLVAFTRNALVVLAKPTFFVLFNSSIEGIVVSDVERSRELCEMSVPCPHRLQMAQA